MAEPDGARPDGTPVLKIDFRIEEGNFEYGARQILKVLRPSWKETDINLQVGRVILLLAGHVCHRPTCSDQNRCRRYDSALSYMYFQYLFPPGLARFVSLYGSVLMSLDANRS
jgi:hypothetical protein